MNVSDIVDQQLLGIMAYIFLRMAGAESGCRRHNISTHAALHIVVPFHSIPSWESWVTECVRGVHHDSLGGEYIFGSSQCDHSHLSDGSIPMRGPLAMGSYVNRIR